ncbi:hypothetical protein Tco_0737848, partial [Tanacetum coccineum]
ATAFSQDQHLAAWAKSSTSMAWNLGPSLTAIESSQAEIRSEISSLKSDILEIKSMMTEIFQAFKEPPSHTEGENDDMQTEEDKVGKEQEPERPTRAVPILAFRPLMRTNLEVEMMTSPSTIKLTDTVLKFPTPNSDAEIELIGSSRPQPIETPTPEAQPITTIISISQSKSSLATKRTDKGKKIATDDVESPKKLVSASKVIREDPDKPTRVPYMINGKMHYLTNDEINAHKEKEDKIKQAVEEAKMFKRPRLNEKFKKAHDAEHQVLKREHSQKVKILIKLNKKRVAQYMWTISNRLKPEPITDVHSPFKFFDFGVTELDELGPIIQKKKNTIVKDLMISLGKRYERLKKITEELGIQSALPAPIPEQAPFQSSGKKRKRIELEPKIKVPGLECNRSLPEGVPFVNNMVIEEPEYGIFFTGVFGDQAFQRWNDIYKVGMDSLVSYLVMALMNKTLKNPDSA